MDYLGESSQRQQLSAAGLETPADATTISKALRSNSCPDVKLACKIASPVSLVKPESDCRQSYVGDGVLGARGLLNDVSATYRGFRRQAIYALSRLVNADATTAQIFQPEGAEDLAVFDDSMSLVEVVQVKDLGRPLVLSDLDPRKPNGFLNRCHKFLENNANLRIVLVHFGTVGEELELAINEDGTQRFQVAKKVARHGYLSGEEVNKVLSALSLQGVSESLLVEHIHHWVSETLAGADADVAVDLLSWWLYRASEDKARLRRDELRSRVMDIGSFIADREAHHSEWFRSIHPLTALTLDSLQRETMERQFRTGVSATFAHISAGVDVVRHAKLTKIALALREHEILIIRGASGQGKSTLALRYLHDFVPEHWRFQVSGVEDSRQSASVARALASHAKALGVCPHVLVEVSSGDERWPELVQALQASGAVKVIVTIREEDWSRTELFQHQFDFVDMPLEFDEQEARLLWQSIPPKLKARRFRHFQDAWKMFGQGTLLLEFIHLVTEGTTLSERVREQVKARRRAGRSGAVSEKELEFLSLVAVASEFECRLPTKDTVAYVGLQAAPAVIESMSREFLIRTSPGGEFLEGLHPVRSAMLVASLCDNALNPWEKVAQRCIKLIDQRQVGSFLLHAAIRYPNEIGRLLPTLTEIRFDTWEPLSGIVRFLLWLGVSDYVRENNDVLNRAILDSSNGWFAILDTDIAEVGSGKSKTIVDILRQMGNLERLEVVERLRAQQSPKHHLFRHLAEWLRVFDTPPQNPNTAADWQGFAELTYWLGQKSLNSTFAPDSFLPALSSQLSSLPVHAVADVVSAMGNFDTSLTERWCDENIEVLVRLIKEATQSTVVEIRNDSVFLDFLIPHDVERAIERLGSKTGSNDPIHEFTIIQLDLVRRLIPTKTRYGGRGHGVGDPHVEQNSYEKQGVLREGLVLRWGPQLNAQFGGLVELRRRPADWQEYARLTIELREQATDGLARFASRLEASFESPDAPPVVHHDGSRRAFSALYQLARSAPSLPKVAVDPWGFIDESRTSGSRVAAIAEGPSALRRYPGLEEWLPLATSLKAFSRALEYFLSQSSELTTMVPELFQSAGADVTAPSGIDSSRVSQLKTTTLLHLIDISRERPRLHRVFSRMLSDFSSESQLGHLANAETRCLERLLAYWTAVSSPAKPTGYRVLRSAQNQWAGSRERILDAISAELTSSREKDLKVDLVETAGAWEDTAALIFSLNIATVEDAEGTPELVRAALWRVLHFLDQDRVTRTFVLSNWERVVVVPLLKGVSLAGDGWSFDIRHVIQSSDPARVRMRFSSNASACEALGIMVWRAPLRDILIPALNAAKELEAIGRHLLALVGMPFPDGQAIDIGDRYLIRVAERSAQLSNQVEAALLIACNEAGADPSDSISGPDRGGQREFGELLSLLRSIQSPQLRTTEAVSMRITSYAHDFRQAAAESVAFITLMAFESI